MANADVEHDAAAQIAELAKEVRIAGDTSGYAIQLLQMLAKAMDYDEPAPTHHNERVRGYWLGARDQRVTDANTIGHVLNDVIAYAVRRRAELSK